MVSGLVSHPHTHLCQCFVFRVSGSEPLGFVFPHLCQYALHQPLCPHILHPPPLNTQHASTAVQQREHKELLGVTQVVQGLGGAGWG